MNKFIKLTAIVCATTLLLAGCANQSTGSVNASTNLAALKTMYVKKYASDNSGVNDQIADQLRNKGVTVTTGMGSPPSNVDAVVSYVDKWMWDITMYMLELTVNIRDPKTGMLMASGHSLHTSLTRKSQTDMVDEVIGAIYKNINIDAAGAAGSRAAAVTSAPVATSTESAVVYKLRELQAMKNEGLITESEFQKKKSKLLEQY